MLSILIPFPLTCPLTLIPFLPVLVILTTSLEFEIKPPFSIFTPFAPLLETIISPFALSKIPVDAIKTPEPELSTDNLPSRLRTVPDTFTSPFVLTSRVSPETFDVFPEISIPLEPEFVISTFPGPKFFIIPATFTPPLAPYDSILILPLSFLNEFAGFKLSVLTSLLNKAAACLLELNFVASSTPAIILALVAILTSAALISTKLRARTLPSIVTEPVPCSLNSSLKFFNKEGALLESLTLLLYLS